jgi:hypothetical protein
VSYTNPEPCASAVPDPGCIDRAAAVVVTVISTTELDASAATSLTERALVLAAVLPFATVTSRTTVSVGSKTAA